MNLVIKYLKHKTVLRALNNQLMYSSEPCKHSLRHSEVREWYQTVNCEHSDKNVENALMDVQRGLHTTASNHNNQFSFTTVFVHSVSFIILAGNYINTINFGNAYILPNFTALICKVANIFLTVIISTNFPRSLTDKM